jgi:anti-sigma regulatory factor (Ser/Thr protein kinase)
MILELRATPEEVMRAVATLQDYARTRQLSEETIFALALALEECASNVVNHALRGNSQQTFQVAFEHAAGAFIIELRDRGPAFDPTTAAGPNPAPSSEAAPGGWGITLVRRCADDICYARVGTENVLRLTRRLGEAADTKSFR